MREKTREMRFLAAAILLSSLSPTARVAADEFIRGDANTDGRVSLADAQMINGYLFFGRSAPACLAAADTDDNGRLDISDGSAIVMHLATSKEIPAPFPAFGADPTPGGDESFPLSCDAYTSTEVVDPEARIEIVDAVAEGGENGTAVITIAISTSRKIWGYSGRINTVSSPIGGFVHIDPDRPSGAISKPRLLFPETEFAMDYVGVTSTAIEFGYLPAASRFVGIDPASDLAVMEFGVCLPEGTPAGDYPLILEMGELIDWETAAAVPAQLVSATLTVLEDVAEGRGCKGATVQECPPVPAVPAELLEARFSLGETIVPPGGEAVVPFHVWSNSEVQGFSLSIDFDETVLQGIAVEKVFEKPDGSDYGYSAFHIDNNDDNPGSGGVDEGTVIFAGVLSFTDNCNNIPAGVETEALRFRFQVVEGTEATETIVEFADGAKSRGQPVQNNVTAHGSTVAPEVAGSFVFFNAQVTIEAEITLFIRADSNGDEVVDLSDAQTTLGFLFLGQGRPSCYDAADANDDGKIEISDALYTLNYLFNGGPDLPPPAGAAGTDPTLDSLGCVYTSVPN